MENMDFVQSTVAAVVAHFAQKGAELTIEKARDMVQEFINKTPGLRRQIDIDEMAKQIQDCAGSVGRTAYDEAKLARYLEMPVADLATVDPEDIDVKLLYNHIRLEKRFSDWLEEWGYFVECGAELIGLYGMEYVPDVYGQLDTLHGKFEVCISFVCDEPPSEDRVNSLLMKIAAYADAKTSFSYGDIFIIVTPSHFTSNSITSISMRNRKENYSIVALDGQNVGTIETQTNPDDRKEELQQEVRLAEDDEAKRNRMKKEQREFV